MTPTIIELHNLADLPGGKRHPRPGSTIVKWSCVPGELPENAEGIWYHYVEPSTGKERWYSEEENNHGG